MKNLWLKIKIWTKGIVFGAAVLYAFMFALWNSGKSVTFWYWFGREPQTSLLVLILATFLAGVIGTILFRMIFNTVRQVRDLRGKNRLEKIEREHAEMKAKAAMLQTRTAAGSSKANGSSAGDRPASAEEAE